jgi:hypothetical protein
VSRHRTAREQVEREVAAHIAVAEALAAWPWVENVFAQLLAGLAEALECEVGVLWVPRGDRLRPRSFWQAEAGGLAEFKVMTLTSRLPRGVESPGMAWQQLEPSRRSSTDRQSPPRWRAAVAAGLRGAIAFPAIWADDVIAVIELVSREELELTEQLALFRRWRSPDGALSRPRVGLPHARRARSLRADEPRGIPVRAVMADDPRQARGVSSRLRRLRSRCGGALRERTLARSRADINDDIADYTSESALAGEPARRWLKPKRHKADAISCVRTAKGL